MKPRSSSSGAKPVRPRVSPPEPVATLATVSATRPAKPRHATFIVDRNGISVRHQVGVENMAWSTDFPRHGNDWPYSRRTIDGLFTDVPAEERRKIVCTNAARFWGLVG